MGELLALSALFLFSANIVVTKLAAGKMPLQLGFSLSVAVNVLLGGLVFLIHAGFRSTPVQFHATAFALFLAAGAFSTHLGRWFFFRAIDVLGPAKASCFQVSNPMFTVVIAWVFLGEELSALSLFAIAIAIAGLLMVSYVPGMFADGVGSVRRRITRSLPPAATPPESLTEALRRASVSGVAIAVISGGSYAVSNVVRGAAIHRWNEPVLGATLGALMGMILHLAAHGGVKATWRDIRSSHRIGLALYGMIGLLTIAAQTCVIAAMRYIPVSIANLITMATPILVTPASYFILKNQEGLRPLTVLGIGLVLTGIGILVLL